MHDPALLLVITLLFLMTGCLEAPTEQTATIDPDTAQSVWTVDLVRTLPGQQAEYLRSIEANWAQARNLALERRAVLSYRALVASPDSMQGWDVMLMTEYADSTAWAQREDIFASIFDSPEYTHEPMAHPSSEVRKILPGDAALRTLVAQPRR